jgi:hypothetical protein
MKIEDLITKLFEKIDKQYEKTSSRLNAIDQTLVKQEENLKTHMYRTELAEKRLEHIESDLEPVKTHINRIDGGLKLLGIISLLLTIVGGGLRFIGLV